MSRSILLFFAVFLLWSCQEEKRPADVLPENKMQAVLWDMMVADELAGSHIHPDSVTNSLDTYSAYYQQVFALHKINKEVFRKSLRYYQGRPDLLKPMLTKLEEESNKRMNPARNLRQKRND